MPPGEGLPGRGRRYTAGVARLAVLTARPDLPIYREVVAAAARAGHTATILDALRVVARSHPVGAWYDGAMLDSGECDAVLPRVGNWRPDSTLAALEALSGGGIPSLNSPEAIRCGRDHWRTAATFAAAGIPHPITVAGAEPEALAAAAASLCGFPCVVKQRRSRQGIGVVRCESRATLEAVLDSFWRLGDEVVVQRFCSPGGISRRVLVLGGEVLGATEHRAPPGEFRANAARGAEVTAVTMDEEAADVAVGAAAVVGLEFAGVDLLPDGARWVVGEVNPTPGWRHFAAATGVDVASLVVEALAARSRGDE